MNVFPHGENTIPFEFLTKAFLKNSFLLGFFLKDLFLINLLRKSDFDLSESVS